MNRSRAVPHCFSSAHRAGKAPLHVQRRFSQTERKAPRSRAAVATKISQSGRNATIMISVAVGACYLLYPRNVYAETASAPTGIKLEAPKTNPSSKEESRDLISSQHLQVKKSWENPGVYAWSVKFSQFKYRPRIKLVDYCIEPYDTIRFDDKTARRCEAKLKVIG